VYDRPGKKPGAEYEPDPIRLRTLCQLRGGTAFACRWITAVFEYGVTVEALVRPLELTEIEGMGFPGGFEPSLAYHGFLQEAEDRFGCCLCTANKRTWWKHKKDAVRHLRKFHFGLADRCDIWYVFHLVLVQFRGPLIRSRLSHSHKCIYSTGEMNRHRCIPLKNRTTLGTTMELATNDGSPLNRAPN
jgi:hypothetical protein